MHVAALPKPAIRKLLFANVGQRQRQPPDDHCGNFAAGSTDDSNRWIAFVQWRSGPSWIYITFHDGNMYTKDLYLANSARTLSCREGSVPPDAYLLRALLGAPFQGFPGRDEGSRRT